MGQDQSKSPRTNSAEPPYLIVISAPSGGGKTTLCNRVLERFPTRIKLSISTTTRKPRGTEQHGKEYFFVEKAEFEKAIRGGTFAEWAKVHDNYYGTSKTFLEQTLRAGQSVLLDIDVQGADSLRKIYGPQCLTFFISPPSMEDLERRLRKRGTDSEEVIQKRLKMAQNEMACCQHFDYLIVNDNLDAATAELLAILEQRLNPAARKAF